MKNLFITISLSLFSISSFATSLPKYIGASSKCGLPCNPHLVGYTKKGVIKTRNRRTKTFPCVLSVNKNSLRYLDEPRDFIEVDIAHGKTGSKAAWFFSGKHSPHTLNYLGHNSLLPLKNKVIKRIAQENFASTYNSGSDEIRVDKGTIYYNKGYLVRHDFITVESYEGETWKAERYFQLKIDSNLEKAENVISQRFDYLPGTNKKVLSQEITCDFSK